MPLDQQIKGRYGEREPRLKILPHAVHDPLAMADHGQHGEHCLHEHTVLPLAVLTQFEVGGVALGSIEAIAQAEVIRKILCHLKRTADPPPIASDRARQATCDWVA
jgi:hypothetical protein